MRLEELGIAVRVKNRFKEPVGGYRDILANVVMPDGTIAEMQVHIEPMLMAKKKMGHLIYEIRREVQGAIDKGKVPEDAIPEVLNIRDALDNISKAFYGPVWDAYVRGKDWRPSLNATSRVTVEALRDLLLANRQVLGTIIPSRSIMKYEESVGSYTKAQSSSDRYHLASGEGARGSEMSGISRSLQNEATADGGDSVKGDRRFSMRRPEWGDLAQQEGVKRDVADAARARAQMRASAARRETTAERFGTGGFSRAARGRLADVFSAAYDLAGKVEGDVRGAVWEAYERGATGGQR